MLNKLDDDWSRFWRRVSFVAKFIIVLGALVILCIMIAIMIIKL